MQTFLPYPDYTMSAHVLDRQRLGKQRVEVLQILNVLHEIKTGYKNHPAVKMWSGCELQLTEYGLVICEEWISRGYKDTCFEKIKQHQLWAEGGNMLKPEWFGNLEFHLGHQATLIKKDPVYYGKIFEGIDPDEHPVIWPVQ